MNFTFSQSQETQIPPTDSAKPSSAETNAPEGQGDSSENYAHGFKVLMQKRIDARIRQSAMQLYQADAINQAITAVNAEVGSLT
jgi:hypothetical protein